MTTTAVRTGPAYVADGIGRGLVESSVDAVVSGREYVAEALLAEVPEPPPPTGRTLAQPSANTANVNIVTPTTSQFRTIALTSTD